MACGVRRGAVLTIAQGTDAVGCTFYDMNPSSPIFDFALEDAFLWQDARENWHALTHKKEPGYGSKGDAGHLFSIDGLTWSIGAASPYNDTIVYTDGSTHTCSKRARPQLVIGAAGQPVYLSTGCAWSKATGDYTVTTVQPVAAA